MNTQLALILAAAGHPMMLQIIFWVLWVLWLVGYFGWNSNPAWPRANSILLLIEIGILGWAIFGFN